MQQVSDSIRFLILFVYNILHFFIFIRWNKLILMEKTKYPTIIQITKKWNLFFFFENKTYYFKTNVPLFITRHRSALKIFFYIDIERNNCILFPNGSNAYRYIPIYCQHHPVAISYLFTYINNFRKFRSRKRARRLVHRIKQRDRALRLFETMLLSRVRFKFYARCDSLMHDRKCVSLNKLMIQIFLNIQISLN